VRQLTRDPAQPLLTLLDGSARVELSGATAANWAAKTANLLTDGLGGPARVGLLLPLHWQAVTLLQGALLTGATVVVAREPAELEGCQVAFVGQAHAEAALDAGVDDVLAVSDLPMGGRLRDLPAMVLDAGAELPVHGDFFAGRPGGRVELGGAAVEAPVLDLGTHDRVLTVLSPADGLLLGLLGPLAAGAALVLCPSGVPDAVRSEGVTASVGVDVAGARRLD
jgi:uncharacterized protein (TIGR03089 family)